MDAISDSYDTDTRNPDAEQADPGSAEQQTADQQPAEQEQSTPLPTAPEPEPIPAPEPSTIPAPEPQPLAEGEQPAEPQAEQAPAEAPAAGEPVVDESQVDAAAAVDEPLAQQVAEETEAGAMPKSAVDHTNAGITGIAEDLQQLQRRERGEAPAENQHDGQVPAEAGEGAAEGESTETEGGPRRGRGRGRGRNRGQNGGEQAQQQGGAQQGGGQQERQQQNQQGKGGQQQAKTQEAAPEAQPREERQPQPNQNQSQNQSQNQDGEGRRGRYRDRKRRGGVNEWDEPEIRDDDVLIPIAGILDVLDNYAFVRTSGYLPGPNDVYVSLGQVKKYHLRKGDAVVGAIRQIPEGEQPPRQKYNALVKVDSINGLPVVQAEGRVEFGQLTPLYPQERLRLETDAQKLSTRIIDLVAPIGKGQRGLIVSPPKAGKTLILQAIANAVTKNNPEAHLMVVLVDERPEEVTEIQRKVNGEVIASTIDRPADDHTTDAELPIDRAKPHV
ncbi:MAG: transcription termination factor Rho, partial [Amnibacterium sp.]